MDNSKLPDIEPYMGYEITYNGVDFACKALGIYHKPSISTVHYFIRQALKRGYNG